MADAFYAFFLSMVNALGRMMRLKYFTLSKMRQYFSEMRKSSAFHPVHTTIYTSCKWVSNNFENKITSFKITRDVRQLNALNIMSSVRIKVAGMSGQPNSMRQNLYLPDWHLKVVILRSSAKIDVLISKAATMFD